MKKLRLDLDSLQIETFEPSPADLPMRGTVEGNTGEYNGTCAVSCNNAPLGGCGGTAGCPGTGGTESGVATWCGCPTTNCVYPSQSCAPGRTFGEGSCYCLYPVTDIRVCCSDAGCTGGGGMC